MLPPEHSVRPDADTIVALATPEGEGGLAVVRLSGQRAVAVARAIFRNEHFRERCRSHRAYLGLAVWPSSVEGQAAGWSGPDVSGADSTGPGRAAGEPLDEVVALAMLAPHSYTGEDTIEFFCHGGRLPARKVIQACLAAGARPAGPGEFTRRAFLKGKLSLDQAEAVADLIGAENDLAASAALQQLRGGLDNQLRQVEQPLRELLADLEGSLEFSPEEEVTVSRRRVETTLSASREQLGRLISLAAAGRHLREGVQVVLAGPPNVGKSSLINALLGNERALVDHEAGTTRDVITETVRKGGYHFVLHDTAGLRTDGGRIERMGIIRTLQALAGADIVLDLVDARSVPAEQARQPLMLAEQPDVTLRAGVRILTVLTKADLLPEAGAAGDGGPALTDVAGLAQVAPGDDVAETRAKAWIVTSTVDGRGIDCLWRKIVEVADRANLREAATLGILLNSRHQYKLIRCREGIESVLQELESGDPGDEILASLLAAILSQLGEISGRVFTENLLDDVFARFCVGK
jgi:tRNA modification GTPase